MSSNPVSDPVSTNIEVVNTYPQSVTCTVFIQSPTGGPAPGPQLLMPPNTMQSGGNGSTVMVQISFPPPTGGSPTTITLPWGAPIDMTRTLNVLWNNSTSGQVIVMVETDIGGES